MAPGMASGGQRQARNVSSQSAAVRRAMNTIIGTFNLRARYEAFREACPSGPHRFVWRRVLNRQRLVLHWPNKSSTARVVGITGAISGLQEQMGLKSGLSTNMG